MSTAITDLVSRYLNPAWLTGPIFDKELRVSSRRRRNYVLRFAYLALLTLFLVMFWIEEVPSSSSGVFQASRMARAGQSITAFIVWFQFCALHAVAAIMLSTAISDEIYHQTLGLLMTTPINSFQIVMGKLFSKLLQLLLLLAISLPLLAVARVFGGVPWGYIVSSVCITLTALLFVGSVSLFLSIFSRRAYVVIILTALTLGLLFAVGPFLAGYACKALTGSWPDRQLTQIIFYPNPYVTMFSNMMTMLSPRAGMGMPNPNWLLHCGIMLAASSGVLFLSVVTVRRVALRQAIGELHHTPRRLRRKPAAQAGAGVTVVARIRRVTGPPVLWRELASPILGRRKILTTVAGAALLLLIGVTYLLCAAERALNDRDTHIFYVLVYTGIGVLCTCVIGATAVTSEKESRSWPLLLATTLTDWQILSGKLVGVARRCMFPWLLLLGHAVLFSILGFVHWVAILQSAILISWTFAFLAGTGMYFGAAFKHTTTAVTLNLAMAFAVWALFPLFTVLAEEIFHTHGELAKVCIDVNPFVHAGVMAEATTGSLRRYDWAGLRNMDAVASTVWMLFCGCVYSLVGFLFAWRAKCRFRRRIF